MQNLLRGGLVSEYKLRGVSSGTTKYEDYGYENPQGDYGLKETFG
jgi:hypothetical protein